MAERVWTHLMIDTMHMKRATIHHVFEQLVIGVLGEWTPPLAAMS
jgi:hypothetical protein